VTVLSKFLESTVSIRCQTSPKEPEREEEVLAECNTARAISGQENHVLLILKALILELHNFTLAIVNGGYMFHLHKIYIYIKSKKGNYTPVVYIQLPNGQWIKSQSYI
jgi:hypothetical protein